MNLLFIDLEFANSFGGQHKVCEFGYVMTDEKFQILERDNFIINPKIERDKWEKVVINEILTRPVEEYESKEGFDFYYQRIKDIFDRAQYVIGHSINCDAKAICDECKRYEFPAIDFFFYDIKTMYRKHFDLPNDVSVAKMLEQLEIKGEDNAHDAGSDAYNTMLEFKAMVSKFKMPADYALKVYREIKGKCSNFEIKIWKQKKPKDVVSVGKTAPLKSSVGELVGQALKGTTIEGKKKPCEHRHYHNNK